MNILFLLKHSRQGASSRLRSLQYIPTLLECGYNVSVSSLFDERYLEYFYVSGRKSKYYALVLYFKRIFVLINFWRYDIIWIEKELFPYFPSIFERAFRFIGKKLVVDYDDAIFHNYDLSKNKLIRMVLGRKIDNVMKSSACVVAGNQYLAQRAKNAGAQRVELIPTVVDSTRYKLSSKRSNPSPVIGWIGSPDTQTYVIEIYEALYAVCQAYGAKLMLVGASKTIVEHLPGIHVDVVPWSEATEAELIQSMDIGIMPLRDGPWEKGKCGYKLIQYMACGVPVVASPIGVNVDIVSQSGCGLLAESPEAWKNALTELLDSTVTRTEFGRAGRKSVDNHYSLQVQAPLLVEIFKSVAR